MKRKKTKTTEGEKEKKKTQPKKTLSRRLQNLLRLKRRPKALQSKVESEHGSTSSKIHPKLSRTR
jgi:hypothetical protein